MKNAKKIGIALLVVLLLVSVVALSSVADEPVAYTGVLGDLNALVDAVPADGTTDAKETALTAAVNYLEKSPVDPTTEGYDAVIVKLKEKMANIAGAYTDESAASTGADVKSAKMTLAEKWAALAFVSEEEIASEAAVALYAKIHTENLVVADLYYQAIEQEKIDTPNVTGEGNVDAALAATQVKRMKNYVADHAFDKTSDAYAEFAARYDAVVAKAEAAKEARRQALLFAAPLDEYGLGVAVNFDFEAGSGTPSLANGTGTDANGNSVPHSAKRETEVIGVDANGNPIENTYYTLRWMASGNPYLNLSYGAATSGMVIEYDITTFDALPSGGMGYQPYAGSSWMGIKGNGDLYGYNGAKETVPYVEGAIVKGEWSHITYIYKPNDRAHCELYLDYVFLGYVHGDTGNKGTVASALRMGNATSSSGSFSIDNVVCTRGTAFRVEDYISTKSAPELFIYYSQYMQDGNVTVPNRIQAYEEATKMVGNYVSLDINTGEPVRDPETGALTYKPLPSDMPVSQEVLKAAVEKYFEYDAQTIIHEYKSMNLVTLRGMIDVLATYVHAPTSASISERNAKMTEINNFILLSGEYILDDSADTNPEKADYNYCMEVLSEYGSRVAMDTLIYDFTNAMTAFRNASSSAMLASKYQEAQDILAEGVDLGLRYEAGYELFLDLYDNEFMNAEKKMESTRLRDNARRFVNSVNYILEIYPTTAAWKISPVVRAEADWRLADIEALNDKYGASVVAPALEWTDAAIADFNESLEYDLLVGWTDDQIASNNATYEYLFKYAQVIRSYAAAGLDENYDGYAQAAEKATDYLAYYYNLLQSAHADVIREQLDLFAASGSFIEKQGILSYIDRYMVENNVDEGFAQIAELLIRYNAYKNELPPQEGDYAELLEQNTVYFINLSKQFASALTYAEKREIYDLATPYYYAMNVGSEEAQAAVALYDALTAELKAVEDASAGLIETVMLIPTATDADTYFAYLVEAALYYRRADASIEGVSEAIEVYTAARDAYNLKVNTDNAQLIECGDALGSLRANCGLSAIISVIIAKLYSF